MYTVNLMVADYEPWWQFDDMVEKFTDEKTYATVEQYEHAVAELLSQFRLNYQAEDSREGKFFAFWNEGEISYCEGCDEDLQVYYGVVLSHPLAALVK